MDDVDTITTSFLTQIAEAGDTAALEDLRVAALGRKGAVTGLMKTLGQAAPEDRKALGQRFNQAKRHRGWVLTRPRRKRSSLS